MLKQKRPAPDKHSSLAMSDLPRLSTESVIECELSEAPHPNLNSVSKTAARLAWIPEKDEFVIRTSCLDHLISVAPVSLFSKHKVFELINGIALYCWA